MPKCCVRNCKNITSRRLKKDGISYFRFPRNPIRRGEWTSIISQQRREDFFKPNNSSVVCTEHFLEEDVYVTSKGIKRLCKTAVPNIVDMTPQDLKIETFKNDENSVDNDGSLQSPSDEIFNNEEMECEISKNNENSVDNDGSLQEPSDEIFNQIKKECVTVPQQEETTIDFESDKSLDIPKTQKNSRLREKNKIIISQQKKLAVQDKTIATQKRLIAKQVKVINRLKANIEDLELKNDKLTKRNEFLRGSLQRLREKVLNENE
ncbi:unnamed protein product [Pieris macdunnoughi]|uniref:THAP-type domain-containing protein n=1 Tax=Pieris macdunnoughi TaxID=345717 RepID=A0A821QTW4_9NEOP|nr:unnamed protein product [Pieris macdunnoughi]